jgi:hypothetical protein
LRGEVQNIDILLLDDLLDLGNLRGFQQLQDCPLLRRREHRDNVGRLPGSHVADQLRHPLFAQRKMMSRWIGGSTSTDSLSATIQSGPVSKLVCVVP